MPQNTHISVVLIVSLVACLPVDSIKAAEPLTAEAVRRSVDRGVRFLKNKQNRGTWPAHADYLGGVTSLCTLALLNAQVPPEDPSIQSALDYLRSIGRPPRTYSVSLQTMVFCLAEPEKDMPFIQRNAAWLEHAQAKHGFINGGWSYSDKAVQADKSNTQFALLALHEAERVGVRVSETTWRRAEDYWLRQQKEDGSWGYRDQGSSGSMTCAGIASLSITSGRLSRGDASVSGDAVQCCGTQQQHDAVERGLVWLGKHFSVTRNPNLRFGGGQNWLYYYLYAVERVGRMTGRRFIGEYDWYREGANYLVSQQDPLTGSWRGTLFDERRRDIATAFALLFLSKGKRPILMCKLKRPGDDWNHHRSDVANLTRYVESRWSTDMNWQVIDLGAADLDDLRQTPVLFINGRDRLEFSAEDEEKLKRYVETGGFIFAEACCRGSDFDQSFRQLMDKLFPDNPLRLLPPDHPVWYAEETVQPDLVLPLYGVDSCCRTSVVYCPTDLSCHWELDDARRKVDYSDVVQQRIQASLSIGANVLTYATSRELKDKLDVEPILDVARSSELPRSALRIAKLQHGGGSDDAPASLKRMLQLVEQHVQLPVDHRRSYLPASDSTLPDFPLLFMHGRRAFRLKEVERARLANYLANGGLIFADAICGNEEFARAFRDEIHTIVPHARLRRIPPDHEIFTDAFGGYDVRRVRIVQPLTRRSSDAPLRRNTRITSPVLEGLEIDGKIAVIFSPLDVSCALESQGSLQCHGYERADAGKLSVNVVLFALQR